VALCQTTAGSRLADSFDAGDPAVAGSLQLVDGLRLEPLGDFWVAYSPLNGLTTLLNLQSAAILEMIADGARNLGALVRCLADSTGDDPERIAVMVRAHLPDLRDAGLLRLPSSGSATTGPG